MKFRSVAYWIATILFCFAMTGGGLSNLIGVEAQRESIVSLGYPIYLMTILGVAKLAGVVALFIPKQPVLKEWAYAGFTFDLIGASASHAFSGHAIPEIMVPLIVLAIALTSYFLRPDGRRIGIGQGPMNDIGSCQKSRDLQTRCSQKLTWRTTLES